MQEAIKDRIKKLRNEIAEISEANRQYLGSNKKVMGTAASEQQRRLQRLQEILDELTSLTDWKKL